MAAGAKNGCFFDGTIFANNYCRGAKKVNRRDFFRKGLTDYVKAFWQTLNNTCSEEISLSTERYFETFLSCYPILSEAPYEALVDVALKKGISIENKSKLELAREIFGRSSRDNNETG